LSAPRQPFPQEGRWDLTQFAAWLTRTREAAQVTRRQLARSVGVDPSTITLWEQAKILPDRPKVEKIGQAFGREDEALQAAGLMPQPASKIWPLDRLSRSSRELLGALAELSHAEQNQLTLLLRIALKSKEAVAS
jgi:transcriptional regulator with XRE-family HTH domain